MVAWCARAAVVRRQTRARARRGGGGGEVRPVRRMYAAATKGEGGRQGEAARCAVVVGQLRGESRGAENERKRTGGAAAAGGAGQVTVAKRRACCPGNRRSQQVYVEPRYGTVVERQRRNRALAALAVIYSITRRRGKIRRITA